MRLYHLHKYQNKKKYTLSLTTKGIDLRISAFKTKFDYYHTTKIVQTEIQQIPDQFSQVKTLCTIQINHKQIKYNSNPIKHTKNSSPSHITTLKILNHKDKGIYQSRNPSLYHRWSLCNHLSNKSMRKPSLSSPFARKHNRNNSHCKKRQLYLVFLILQIKKRTLFPSSLSNVTVKKPLKK